ncbi:MULTISPECIES: hypothetical protein [Acidobacteriaceae]|uniref:hypothetical protein n=1 Tax=Acidobacteriaceae TaxID=204434 RepID=UPI00131C8F44|nr:MULTISPECIES: hypothetical protein [Acidobacteriaceae]MDW5264320.1 hypothetical protein [Edaphobacter sp.]
MLMAAVTSTSPGTDTANTWSASSERTESLGISFAESFDGGSALTGETQSPVADQIKPMAMIESEVLTSGKSSSMGAVVSDSKAKGGENAAGKIQNGSANVLLAALGIKKTIAHVLSKTSSSVTAAVPLSGGKLSGGTDTDIQSEMSDGQTSSVTSGNKNDHAQKLTDGVTDGKTLDSLDGQVDLDTEGATPGKLPETDSVVQRVVESKSEISSPDKSQKTSSARKMIKDHDASVKTEKASKSASKSVEKAGMGQAVVGIEGQTAVYALAIVNPMGRQQSGAGVASDANLLSPILSSASGRSAGTAVAVNSKSSKETANTENPDEGKMKTSESSSTENAASQKTEADASKTGFVIASNPDEDKAKVQSMAALGTVAGQLHAVSDGTGPIVGDVAGRALTHDAGVNLHMTDAISHAVSTVQTGSNPADATVSADLAHKTLMVTPTSLEVGVSNGTHGWLKIRAEMADGGAINTSLSTASSSGQEMLHRELPSLTAYLHSEHVAVNAVVVQPTVAGETDFRNSFGGTGGTENGQAQQSDGRGRESRQGPTNAVPTPAGTSALYSGAEGEEVFSSASYAGGGNWLSVRA